KRVLSIKEPPPLTFFWRGRRIQGRQIHRAFESGNKSQKKRGQSEPSGVLRSGNIGKAGAENQTARRRDRIEVCGQVEVRNSVQLTQARDGIGQTHPFHVAKVGPPFDDVPPVNFGPVVDPLKLLLRREQRAVASVGENRISEARKIGTRRTWLRRSGNFKI